MRRAGDLQHEGLIQAHTAGVFPRADIVRAPRRRTSSTGVSPPCCRWPDEAGRLPPRSRSRAVSPRRTALAPSASRSVLHAARTRRASPRRSSGGRGIVPRASARSARSSSSDRRGLAPRISEVARRAARTAAPWPSPRPIHSLEAVVPQLQQLLRVMVTLPSFEPIPVAVIDSGVDGSHRSSRKKSSTPRVRRRVSLGRLARTRDVRRRAHRSGGGRRHRDRGARPSAQLLSRRS